MLEADARALLEAKVQYLSEPTLTVNEVTALLNFCKTADDAWALDIGAAEGWRWKAGKVAAAYSFAIDGQTSDQGQVYRNCLMQADQYAARANASSGFAIVRAVPAFAETIADEPDPQ